MGCSCRYIICNNDTNVMEEDFVLADDMFTDAPDFVDTSHEFDDDCGDACKI